MRTAVLVLLYLRPTPCRIAVYALFTAHCSLFTVHCSLLVLPALLERLSVTALSLSLSLSRQWAGSCWYYLRFADPTNTERPWGEQAENDWLPVDVYVTSSLSNGSLSRLPVTALSNGYLQRLSLTALSNGSL